MLDKIKELLGEELSKQVEEKLGKTELAIMNDGSVVPADKYEGLKTDNKALETKYQTDVADFTKKLNDAVAGTQDYDVLKTSLETLKADNQKAIEQYQTDITNTKMDSAIDVALIKANIDEKYIPLLKTQINRNDLKFDNDTLIGLDTSVASLQTEYPKMFGEIKKMGNPPNSDGKTPDMGARAKLVEQYNVAQKSKDFKAMFSLQNQIKQIKE